MFLKRVCTFLKRNMRFVAAIVTVSWSIHGGAVPLRDGTAYSEPLSYQQGTCTGTPCTSIADELTPYLNRAAVAFDGSTITYWMASGVQRIFCGPTYSCSSAGHLYWHTTGILGFRLTRSMYLYQYEITPSGDISYAPKNWTFEGYSSATGWRTLDTINDYLGFRAGIKSVFRLATPGMYSEYRIRVTANYGGDQLQIAELTLQGIPSATLFDVDGNRKAEMAVYRPNTGEWILSPPNPRVRTPPPTILGQLGDQIVPADYNGDGKTDLAVWRPSTGQWIVIYSNENMDNAPVVLRTFGQSNDIPMPGDYDGDGKADLVVYRPSTSQWIQRLSSRNYNETTRQFGAIGDKPVSGDFDGDGKTDFATWNTSLHLFSVLKSKGAVTETFSFAQTNGFETPAPGDYDGDGKTDFALYQAATAYWYIRNSSDAIISRGKFGGVNGIPAVADYDGDGITDLGFFDPATKKWTIRNSSTRLEVTTTQGAMGDQPLPAAFIH